MAPRDAHQRVSPLPISVALEGRGVRCPKCLSGRRMVIDSRPTDDAVRRRSVCSDCGYRYTTHERVSEQFGSLGGSQQEVEAVERRVPGWARLSVEDRGTIRRLVAALAGTAKAP